MSERFVGSKLASLLLVVMLLSSCSKVFQVYHTESPNVKKEGDKYVFENDSVKVLYNLWDKNGRMMFAIQNKLKEPITIDWQKSKFSQNGQLNPYWRNQDRISTKGRSSTWGFVTGYNIWGFSSYSSTSLVDRDVKNTLLPPGEWMERVDYNLIGEPDDEVELEMERMAKQGARKIDRNRAKKKMEERGRDVYEKDSVEFSSGQSPVRFRNYLTYTIGDDVENTSSIDNSFEVVKIESKGIGKRKLYSTSEKEKSASKFYSLRTDKRRNIQYPKNNLFVTAAQGFNIPTKRQLSTGIDVGFELGYSRLIKNRLELGLSYEYVLRWVSLKSFNTLIGFEEEAYFEEYGGHTVNIHIRYYILPKRRSRLSLGVTGFLGFHGDGISKGRSIFQNYRNFKNYTMSEAVVGGAKLEIGGNFGGSLFNVNPFVFGGFQTVSGGTITAKSRFGTPTPDIEYPGENMSYGLFGLGIRFRFQFPRIN